MIYLRSAFGKRDDGYVKRLDDYDSTDKDDPLISSKTEEAPSRKRVATDVLTEVCIDASCSIYSKSNG